MYIEHDNIQETFTTSTTPGSKKEEERRKKEKAAGEARHRSGDTCPPAQGAPRLQAQSRNTPPNPPHPSTGEVFPSLRSSGNPCSWSAGGLTGHEGAFVIGGRLGAAPLNVHPPYLGGLRRCWSNETRFQHPRHHARAWTLPGAALGGGRSA